MGRLTKSLILLSLTLLFVTCKKHQNFETVDQQIDHLTAFTKVFGYIKYFHPSDEAREIDWDKLAVYGVNKIKKVKNEQELREVLESIFTPIAPTISIHDSEPDKNQFIFDYLNKISTDTTGLKTIAWQHKGVYLGTDFQPYRSSRTYRNDFNLTRSIALFQYLDSDLLSGKEIRLSSLVRSKIANQESNAELIIVTENQKVVNKKIELKEISSEWDNYELQSLVEENTGTLLVGIQIQGSIDMEIDEFKIEYRPDSSDWKTYPLKNMDFIQKKAVGLKDWEINSTGLFEFEVTSDESNFGNKTLRIASKPKLYDQTPNVGETYVHQISEQLWIEIPLALYGTAEYTLPQSNASTVQKQLFNIYKKEIDQIELGKIFSENENMRIADIIIAWNIFQHFYPYFNEVNVNWDQVLTSSLRKALQDKTGDDFLKTLQWMVSQLKDGHGVTTCPNTIQLYKAPIKVDELEGEMVVTESQIGEIMIGDIIKSVDGIPAFEELNKRIDLISGSDQLRKYRALNMFGAGNRENKALFEIEKVSGETILTEVSRTSSANLYTAVREFNYPAIEMIEEDIFLINLRKITQSVFEENLQNLSKAKGIIFDYRNGSNSSFSMFDIVPYLIKNEVQSPNWYTPEVIYPDQKNMQLEHSTWTLAPKSPFIKGKKVILNAPGIVSSGETTMGIIDHYDLATLIGSPTAGTNGNTNFINLPGNCRIMWTGMKVLKHDGSQLHLIGYEPDIVVERSIEALRNNRDESLIKALEVITREGE